MTQRSRTRPSRVGTSTHPRHPAVRRGDTGRIALATFEPRRTDDLDPSAADHTGWRGRWQCLGTIDDRHSPYDGQRLWWVLDDGPFFGWVPEADLADLVD